MFLVELKHHNLLVNSHEFAVRHCGCRPHAQRLSSQATFSKKLSLAQYAQACFLANRGYDSESYLARLDIKHRIARCALSVNCLFPCNRHNSPPLTDGGKEFPWVEGALFFGRHDRCCQWLLLMFMFAQNLVKTASSD